MNSRKYQRSSRNWISGRLTNTSQSPAGESRPSPAPDAYQAAPRKLS